MPTIDITGAVITLRQVTVENLSEMFEYLYLLLGMHSTLKIEPDIDCDQFAIKLSKPVLCGEKQEILCFAQQQQYTLTDEQQSFIINETESYIIQDRLPPVLMFSETVDHNKPKVRHEFNFSGIKVDAVSKIYLDTHIKSFYWLRDNKDKIEVIIGTSSIKIIKEIHPEQKTEELKKIKDKIQEAVHNAKHWGLIKKSYRFVPS